jgi:uncharacterized membrane protein
VYREMLPMLIILLMFAIGYYAEPRLLTNAQGQVMGISGSSDSWTAKAAAAYLIPLVTLVIYLGLLLIPKIEVYRKNLDDFSDQFWGFKVVLVFAMCAISLSALLPNLGYWNTTDPMIIVIPAIAMLFFYVGYMLNFTKRNYFIGIGTPWTLADERIWEKTNRLGSKLFWALGVVSLVSLVAPADSRLLIIMVLIGLVMIGLYAYSLGEYMKTKKVHDKRRKKK